MSGYEKPNYTQIPNILFDVHMPKMKEAELRVVLAIARATFGWHKQKDKLSLSQLMEKTGLKRAAVVRGIQEGMERGVIAREESGMSFLYSLVIEDKLVSLGDQYPKDTSSQKIPEVVSQRDQLDPKLVSLGYTQKKVFKESIKERGGGDVDPSTAREPVTPTQQPPPQTRSSFYLGLMRDAQNEPQTAKAEQLTATAIPEKAVAPTPISGVPPSPPGTPTALSIFRESYKNAKLNDAQKAQMAGITDLDKWRAVTERAYLKGIETYHNVYKSFCEGFWEDNEQKKRNESAGSRANANGNSQGNRGKSTTGPDRSTLGRAARVTRQQAAEWWPADKPLL